MDARPAAEATRPNTALVLLAAAVAERQQALREPFLAAAGTARDQARSLLGSDADRQRGGPAPAALAAALGGLAERHLDPAGLAGVLGNRSQGAPLSAVRRQRLEAALADLAAAWEARPVLVTAAGDPLPTPAGFERYESPQPLATAAELRDAATAALGRALAALAAIRRELEGQATDDQAVPPLAAGWEDLAERRGLLPPVVVWAAESALRSDGGAALLAALASGRALQVVTSFDPLLPVGASWDPVLAAVGLRQVYVHEALEPAAEDAAGVEALRTAFRRGLAAAGPALHRLARPAAGAATAPALLAGRAITPLVCDPAAGEGWSRRLTLLAPAPDADWGSRSLRVPRPGGVTEVRELPLTFADAALAAAEAPGSPWRGAAGEAGDGEELVPLVEWLEQPAASAAALVPWTWSAGAAEPHRLALRHDLAAETRQRLLRWRALQELAGVRGEALARAAEAARAEEQEIARTERAALTTAHEYELETLGQAAEQAAVDRLVSALLGVDARDLAAPDPFAGFRGRDAEEVAAALMAVVGPPAGREDA